MIHIVHVILVSRSLPFQLPRFSIESLTVVAVPLKPMSLTHSVGGDHHMRPAPGSFLIVGHSSPCRAEVTARDDGMQVLIPTGMALGAMLILLTALWRHTGHVSAQQESVTCRSQAGQHVDWWIALKWPANASPASQDVPAGSAFSYIDSSSTSWRLGADIGAVQGNALAATLRPLYEAQQPGLAYLLYNDAFPNGTVSITSAHAKGVLASDELQGFWLVHSAPKFPTAPSSTVYQGLPLPEHKYGQSFLCVSFARQQLERVVALLALEQVHSLEATWPESALSAVMKEPSPKVVDVFTDIIGAVSGPGTLEQSHHEHVQQPLQSLGGVQLMAFAKAPSQDPIFLYEQLVEPAFGSAFAAETWQNGWGPMPSLCPPVVPFPSLNVRTINVQQASWPITEDHSKYALSLDSGHHVVCIGDLNRETHQLFRGGGTLCFVNYVEVHAAFAAVVESTDICPHEPLQIIA